MSELHEHAPASPPVGPITDGACQAERRLRPDERIQAGDFVKENAISGGVSHDPVRRSWHGQLVANRLVYRPPLLDAGAVLRTSISDRRCPRCGEYAGQDPLDVNDSLRRYCSRCDLRFCTADLWERQELARLPENEHVGGTLLCHAEPGKSEWHPDSEAPHGRCVLCLAPFTAAGGLTGGVCVRCSKTETRKCGVLAESKGMAGFFCRLPSGHSGPHEFRAPGSSDLGPTGPQAPDGPPEGVRDMIVPHPHTMAAVAVDTGSSDGCFCAPGVRPWHVRLGHRLFPRAWPEYPEFAESHDGVNVSVLCVFDWKDRLLVETRVATEHKAGSTRASSAVSPLPPAILEDKV